MRKFLKEKKTRKACKIYAMLWHNAHKKHLSFHTPGHKIGKWDITELSFSDNLSAPKGCIAAAEKDVAEILGAAASFFLTDGSTSGVLSMLYTAKTLGVKTLAVFSPAHKSVYNGCSLLGLRLLQVEKEDYEQALQAPETTKLPSWLKKSDGLLLTSPDYYGNVPPVSAIRTLCDRANIPLLIDGAHGGHLHYTKNLYAGTYADLWVDGVHKSLPALTQGAVVSAKTQKYAEALKGGVDIFRTTSPSYPVLASVEYAVKYPQNVALEKAVRAYAQTDTRLNVHEDYTKLCALFGQNAYAAQAYLERKGIYAEFCDGNEICFYLSPATKPRHFKALRRRLSLVLKLFPFIGENSVQRIPAPLVFNENAPKEWVALSDSIGRISGANCGLFPPCTPLLYAGEKITEEKITRLKEADNVFGVWQEKILVIKEENV